MTVNLLVDLVARQPHVLGIDHDDVISAIEARRVARLILADQKPRDARRQAPEHLPFRVHHEPIFADRERFGFPTLWNIRPHLPSHTFPSRDKR